MAVAWGTAGRGVAAQGTGFVTPTPGPDGKIIYIVQQDDALWTIAALERQER